MLNLISDIGFVLVPDINKCRRDCYGSGGGAINNNLVSDWAIFPEQCTCTQKECHLNCESSGLRLRISNWNRTTLGGGGSATSDVTTNLKMSASTFPKTLLSNTSTTFQIHLISSVRFHSVSSTIRIRAVQYITFFIVFVIMVMR